MSGAGRRVFVGDVQGCRGALERLLESSEHQAAVADILEPIYKDGGASGRLVDVYERFPLEG